MMDVIEQAILHLTKAANLLDDDVGETYWRDDMAYSIRELKKLIEDYYQDDIPF